MSVTSSAITKHFKQALDWAVEGSRGQGAGSQSSGKRGEKQKEKHILRKVCATAEKVRKINTYVGLRPRGNLCKLRKYIHWA